jgi:hypothetical protein
MVYLACTVDVHPAATHSLHQNITTNLGIALLAVRMSDLIPNVETMLVDLIVLTSTRASFGSEAPQ